MKVIIAGSRDYHNYNTLLEIIAECNWNITEVISGGEKGVDSLGERWADENDIRLKIFSAHWQKYGRSAVPIRNRKMVENADALIAIMKSNSKGIKNMIETAEKFELLIFKKIL